MNKIHGNTMIGGIKDLATPSAFLEKIARISEKEWQHYMQEYNLQQAFLTKENEKRDDFARPYVDVESITQAAVRGLRLY